jgi:hypothetical protein
MRKIRPRSRHPKKARKVTTRLGAPPKPYRRDPDRHAIAFARAMERVRGYGQNEAFDLTASWFYGREVEHEKGRRRQPPGTVAIAWYTRPGAGASSIRNKAKSLIEKSTEWWGGGRRGEYRRLSMEDAQHLKTLIWACQIALNPTEKQVIFPLLDILASIGEREFGEKRLAPLILQKASPHDLFLQV